MFPKLIWLLSLSLLLILPSISSPIWESTDSSEGIVQSLDIRNPRRSDYAINRREAPSIKHFYDVTGSRYEPLWDDMESKGFRLISLSIYGPSSSPRFAVVYKKETGPKLWSAYNVKQERWNEWLGELKDKGYTLVAVSATGDTGDVRYAGLAQKGVTDSHNECGLTSNQMNDLHEDQRTKGRIMKTVRQYGSSTNRRYCALFHGNPTHEKYTFFKGQEHNDYKIKYKAQLTKRYWYPGFISISEDGRYSAIFTNTYRGSTHSDSKMTAKQLEDKIVEQRRNGLYLHTLQASGSGSRVIFAGLWSSLDVQPRTWRTRTEANKQVSNAFKSEVDGLIKTFMTDNGIRQGQFAISKGGDMLFERAYTWSENNRRTTLPNDRFYLASCSKPFAAAAATALYNAHRLTPSTKIVDVLGLPASPADPRFKNITVSHLINHRGGFDRSKTKEAAHEMRQVALDMSSGARPASTSDVATWIARRQLDFDPGAQYAYSNDGYLLLGRTVEKASGREFFNYLNSTVLHPNNLDVGFWVTDPTAHEDDRVIQEDWGVGLSTLYPKSTDEVAKVFGGGGRYFESSKSATSLTASAGTLTRFASRHAVRGNGGRVIDCKDGSAPGARTMVCSAGNGFDWAVVFSTRDFPLNTDGDGRFTTLIGKVKTLVNNIEI